MSVPEGVPCRILGTESAHIGELHVINGTHYTPTGKEVLQVFDYFPALKFLYPFDVENRAEVASLCDFALDTLGFAVGITAVYVIAIFTGQALMRSRKPFNLKKALAAWNLFLAVFSFAGMIRVVLHLAAMLYHHGFRYTVTHDAETAFGQGAAGLWTMLFVYSKVAELADTAFIVARKRKLIFLHWYHHVTVLLYCWHAYGTRSSAGIWFAAMNYSVHAFMYFYYFLAAIGKPPKWGLAVTTLQLSQMVVGVGICVAVAYYKYYLGMGDECHVQTSNFAAAIVMYSSYFLLFLLFFIQRYCTTSKRPQRATTVPPSKAQTANTKDESVANTKDRRPHGLSKLSSTSSESAPSEPGAMHASRSRAESEDLPTPYVEELDATLSTLSEEMPDANDSDASVASSKPRRRRAQNARGHL